MYSYCVFLLSLLNMNSMYSYWCLLSLLGLLWIRSPLAASFLLIPAVAPGAAVDSFSPGCICRLLEA
jgi:hypothetical protein